MYLDKHISMFGMRRDGWGRPLTTYMTNNIEQSAVLGSKVCVTIYQVE
jgi:hypothetical protein